MNTVQDLINELSKFDPKAKLVGQEHNGEFVCVYKPYLFEDDGEPCEYSNCVVVSLNR